MSFQKPIGPIKIDKKTLQVIAATSDIIIATARAYVEADVQVQPGAMTITLSEQQGIFAKVNVGVPEGGGYYLILKKVNDIWVVLVGGQDLPGQDMGKKYGLPPGWFSTEY